MDKCDSCGAEGRVQVHSDSSERELTFCGHHYNELADALVTSGWAVTEDLRPQLLAV